MSENTTRANSPTPMYRGGSSLIDMVGENKVNESVAVTQGQRLMTG